MKRLISILYILLVVSGVKAQVSVEAKIDSTYIFIGQQTRVTVTATAKNGSDLVFPSFKRTQMLVPGIEVLAVSDADTVSADDEMRVSKTYTITSFDEKPYRIPGFSVKSKGKTYTSNELALKVISPDVDTTRVDQFFPPKDVQDNPFLWSEWASLFWLSLVVLVLCVAFAYLLVCLKQNKPITISIRIVKKIPPHTRALNEMGKLKDEHLASSDDQKTYYTQLTDTLRRYIKERFGFNAMEMTSDEILFNLKENGTEEMIGELRELFQTADLVKFAKYSTMLNENDRNLVSAVNFIDKTKNADQQAVEEKIVPELSETEKKTRQNRAVIKWALVAIGLLVLGVSAMIVCRIYQLI